MHSTTPEGHICAATAFAPGPVCFQAVAEPRPFPLRYAGPAFGMRASGR